MAIVASVPFRGRSRSLGPNFRPQGALDRSGASWPISARLGPTRGLIMGRRAAGQAADRNNCTPQALLRALQARARSPAFIAGGLARIQVRYPEIHFADSRRFAEEWTYRFLAAALADSKG